MTDLEGPTERRLTMFALPMDRPGIAVRPLRQLDGHVKFNEVVIGDVAVGEADAVGPVGDAWRVAMGMLAGKGSRWARHHR